METTKAVDFEELNFLVDEAKKITQWALQEEQQGRNFELEDIRERLITAEASALAAVRLNKDQITTFMRVHLAIRNATKVMNGGDEGGSGASAGQSLSNSPQPLDQAEEYQKQVAAVRAQEAEKRAKTQRRPKPTDDPGFDR